MVRTISRVRKSLRCGGFNYSAPGAYFVTICVQNRERIFGQIAGRKMVLNELGKCVSECWQRITRKYPTVSLDEWVIMPDHFHAVLWINDLVGAGLAPAPIVPTPIVPTPITPAPLIGVPARGAPTRLSDIIGGFKSKSTVEYIRLQRNENPNQVVPKLWQRSYHDRVIRDDEELERIRLYIRENPQKWHGEHRGDETSPLQVDEPGDIG